jgi:hypothetical protein
MEVINDWLILEISFCKSQAFKGRIFAQTDACVAGSETSFVEILFL